MAKQNITVKIIGKPYPLAIDGEKEELYRLAEREINAYVTRIEQAHFKGFSKEDCLAGSVNEEASDVEVRCVGRKKRERRALRREQ